MADKPCNCQNCKRKRKEWKEVDTKHPVKPDLIPVAPSNHSRQPQIITPAPVITPIPVKTPIVSARVNPPEPSKPTPPQFSAFCGVTSDQYDIKLVKEGVIPFIKGVVTNSEHPGITVDEYGEIFIFEFGGLYRFVLDLDVVQMSSHEGSLRLSVSNINKDHQYLTLLPISSTGIQHTSTTVPISAGSKVQIMQTGQTEITIKAGSVKVQIYRVG